jgi:hypothetical protein
VTLRGIAAAIVVTALLCLAGGCSNSSGAREALEAQGFRDIETTGWAMFGCSDSDGTCTGFHAVGPTGARVRGVVGCGYVFKGCTVRVTGAAK